MHCPEGLLDAFGDSLEAFCKRRHRGLDPLRPGERRLDALRELGDALVDPLEGLVRLHPPGEVGDGILEPRRILGVVVRLSRRRRHRCGARQGRDRRARIRPLLREGAGKLEPRYHSPRDKDLAERLRRPLLLCDRLGEGLLGNEAVRQEDVPDRAPRGVVSHRHHAHAEPPRVRARRQERAGRGKAAAEPTRVVSAALPTR